MSLNRFFDHDEFEAMHTTWKMFQGGEIYTDFIQHHHPFMYYTLLPLYAIFGGTTDVLIAARVFIFFQLAGMLLLTYLIAFEVYRDRLIALTGTLFLSLSCTVSRSRRSRFAPTSLRVCSAYWGSTSWCAFFGLAHCGC